MPALSFLPVPGLPVVKPGNDLGRLLVRALRQSNLVPASGDVLAVAQKIVSKAEGRLVNLATVTPSPQAEQLAAAAGKDPRAMELLLRESAALVRVGPGVVISEHRTGTVLANAGIDRSNVAGNDELVLLLPEDPDASAARLKDWLQKEFGVPLGVIITDSIGRPWRLGTTGAAIGCAGVDALRDLRGRPDLFGRALQVSEVAIADSLAAAAVLVMGEGAEGVPAVLIRGAAAGESTQTARDVLRPAQEDLFRR